MQRGHRSDELRGVGVGANRQESFQGFFLTGTTLRCLAWGNNGAVCSDWKLEEQTPGPRRGGPVGKLSAPGDAVHVGKSERVADVSAGSGDMATRSHGGR